MIPLCELYTYVHFEENFNNIMKVKSSAFWLNFEDQYVSIFIDFSQTIAKYGLRVLQSLYL